MTEDRPKCRHFQFSLRKLLLWTAMLALFLGILQLLDLETGFTTIAACWAAVVAMVRTKRGSEAAYWFSAWGGGALLTLAHLAWAFVTGRLVFHRYVLVVMFLAFLAGFVVFLVVDAAFRIVQWADAVMETE